MKTIPPEVSQQILKMQDDLNWPESVPAFVEIPNADGEILFHRYQECGLGEFEQATEYNVREAKRLLKKWSRGRSKKIARHILLARIYRCKFISLMDCEETADDELPFENGQYEEV